MKISILANCQAGPLAQIISYLAPSVEVEHVFLVHLLKREQTNDIIDKLKRSDLVISQPLRKTYNIRELQTSSLRPVLGDKMIVVPNLFLSLPFPDLVSLWDVTGKSVKGPMDVIHYKTVIHGFLDQIPQERVVGWFLDSGHYSAAEAKTYELDAYSCLREREIMCDVLMSDYIGSHIGEVYLFHTFNHPVDKLLYELAIRILRLAGKGMGKIDPHIFGLTRGSRALSIIGCPADISIQRHLGWKYDCPQLFKGLYYQNGTVGKTERLYTLDEFVSISYDFYSRWGAELVRP